MNNPYENQIQSFKKYAEYVRTKKLADKMLMDNLLAQLVESRAAPILNDVAAKLDKIEEKLAPVTNFFTNTPEPAPVKKRISAKQKKIDAFEEHQKMLKMAAVEAIKNGG